MSKRSDGVGVVCSCVAFALKFVRKPVAGKLQTVFSGKRQECVDDFNKDPTFFAFLLSSKAGGCGRSSPSNASIGPGVAVHYDCSGLPVSDHDTHPSRSVVSLVVCCLLVVQSALNQRRVTSEGGDPCYGTSRPGIPHR